MYLMAMIINRYLLCLFVAILGLGGGCSSSCDKQPAKQIFFSPQKDDDNFVVLYTANMQGYVEPCGCTSNPLGGVSRMSALVQQARAAYGGRVLLIDAGNLLFDTTSPRNSADACLDETRVDFLLSSLQALGLKATTFGPYDSAMGKPWRDAALKRFNINSVGRGESPSSVIDVQSVPVGVIGLTASNQKQVKLASQELRNEVASLRRQGVKAVIVLSQSSRNIVKAALADIDGVDVVILGDSPGEIPAAPERTGDTGPWLVASGMHGQYLGVIEFFGLNHLQPNMSFQIDDRQSQTDSRVRLLDARIEVLKKELLGLTDQQRKEFLSNRLNMAELEKRELLMDSSSSLLEFAHFTTRSIPVEKNIVPEVKIHDALVKYEAALPTVMAACEANLKCPQAPQNKPHYVGVNQCKLCHMEAFKMWEKATVVLEGKDEQGRKKIRNVGHSVAWATLENANKVRDRTCIGCHSVGFMEPGGYCKFDDIGTFKNVQCESCHGPGSDHVASPNKKNISRDVPESSCRKCHHVPHIESTASFDYKVQVQKILGPGHGEALLKRLQHGTQASTGD